jgi:hypothetical protein
MTPPLNGLSMLRKLITVMQQEIYGLRRKNPMVEATKEADKCKQHMKMLH